MSLQEGLDQASSAVFLALVKRCFPALVIHLQAIYLSSLRGIERRETNQAKPTDSKNIHSSARECCPVDQLCLQPFHPGPLGGCDRANMVTETQSQRLRVGGCPAIHPRQEVRAKWHWPDRPQEEEKSRRSFRKQKTLHRTQRWGRRLHLPFRRKGNMKNRCCQ